MINKNSLLIKDYSLFILFASNIFTIILAAIQNWNLGVILWIFWCQSVIIGFFNFITINRRKVNPSMAIKYFTAFFFILHYGFFHFVYAIFLYILSVMTNTGFNDMIIILSGAGIFLLNHTYSFFVNIKNDKKNNEKSIGKIMFFPYVRIIPMHLTIIFGFVFLFLFNKSFVLVFFLILKTIADLIMHYVEHRN